jgi:hypothetical protein
MGIAGEARKLETADSITRLGRMAEINVDGVIYEVSEATADPSEMRVHSGGKLVGSIGRFGDHYRFSEPDGRATTIVRPRSAEGIEQILREVHARHRAP